jgi:hypothetical protein
MVGKGKLNRYVKSVVHDDSKEGRCKLDSHAGTIVGGNNCIVLDTTGRTVNVSLFLEEYKSLTDIPIAALATAYEDPSTGEVRILILHEALYFGERLSHMLICPNQLRNHGIIVDDNLIIHPRIRFMYPIMTSESHLNWKVSFLASKRDSQLWPN